MTTTLVAAHDIWDTVHAIELKCVQHLPTPCNPIIVATKRPAAAMARPASAASWHEQAEPGEAHAIVPAPQAEPEKGDVDSRTTTMAQRHVFKLNRHRMDPALLEKFDHYKSKECKIAGKEKLANEIVNAVVPRDARYSASTEPNQRAAPRPAP